MGGGHLHFLFNRGRRGSKKKRGITSRRIVKGKEAYLDRYLDGGKLMHYAK